MAKKPAPKKKSKPAKSTAAKKAVPKKKAVKPASKPEARTPAKAAASEPKKPAAPAAPVIKMSGNITPLNVSAQGSGGNAASGNTHPANILVVVSNGGIPIADLQQSHFTVMEHFNVPNQQYPFSNNIVGFRNAGSGAYLVQVKPINNAPWSSGHHIAHIIVSGRNMQGMTAVKIIVR